MVKHMALILALACLFCSCSQVEDARHIVAEADSLRNAGQSLSPFSFHLSPSQSDSATIASAVSALEPLRLIYPTAYAHANYYYGRLLREAGNQPEAMLAFLRVIHSRTQDHIIKGRSWSNIANMCRLAADHELAYEIYKRSAEEFLKANDSIAYYYAINNYAYECAEMRKKTIAFESLKIIEEQCIDSNVMARVLETKAEACLKSNEYDSVLFFINHTYPPFSRETSNLLLRAQAFSYLEEKDSALFYALQVINGASSWFEKNNAYYILANFDDSSSKSDVLQLAADRSDVQKLIEIRQGQLSQATQLLEQDLSRKPDLSWFYAILVTLLLIGIGITAYVNRKRRQHRLLSQQMNDIQQRKLEEIEKYCGYLQNCTNLEQELSWTNYDRMCEIINRNMYQLILSLQSYDNLTEGDIRLCVLVLIDLSYANMASMLKLSKKSISKLKSIAAHKLNTNMKNLREKLLEIACNSVAK